MSVHSSDLGRRYRRQMVFGAIVLGLLAVPALIHSGAAIATLRNTPVLWLPESSSIRSDFFQFVDKFGLSDVVFISWPNCKLDDPSVQRVTELLRPVTAEDSSADSPPSFSGFKDTQWAADFHAQLRDLCQNDSPLDWVRSGTQMRDRLTEAPISLSQKNAVRRLSKTVIGPDDQQTCIVVSLGLSTYPHHRQVIPLLRSSVARAVTISTDQVYLVGGALDGVAVDEESVRSIERFSPFSSVIAALLCWLCLRSAAMTIAITAVATIGQGMVLALVYYLGMEMNAILIVLPALVFVLTISSGIHLGNYYLDVAGEAKSTDDADRAIAARTAMKIGTTPCVLATVTTVVGLLSLLLVRLQPVHTFGFVASAGILFTLLMLFLVMPGAMTFSKPRTTTAAEPKLIRQCFWLDWPRLTIVTFIVLSALLANGLTKLSTSVSVPRMFGDQSELRQQYGWYEKHVGPTMTGDLLVSFPTDDPNSDSTALDQLKTSTNVHTAISQVPGIGGVLSAATFLPPVPKGRRVRDVARRNAVRGLIDDPDSSLHQWGYVTNGENDRTWRISLRMYQTGDEDFGSRIDAVAKVVDAQIHSSNPTKPPSVAFTGHVVVVQRTQQILLQDLFRSFIAAFGIIFIVMSVSLRSLVGGLLAMIPNVVPTFVLFGTMGWLESPLDIGSVMTASVALGIAVDDTVHLISRYRFHRKTRDALQAAAAALKQCAIAMFQTTLICSGSLMVYALSDFVPTRRFSLFMFGLLAIAFLGVAVLLPAILSTSAGRFFCRGVNKSANQLASK